MIAAYLVLAGAAVDPITAILTRDWVSVGAWSMLIGTWAVIVVGSFREWWVPGVRHRRLETASAEQSKSLASAVKLAETLAEANEITSYFFQEVPKRRKATQTEEPE